MTDVKVNILKTTTESAVFSAQVPVLSYEDDLEPSIFEVKVTVTSTNGRLMYEVEHEETLWPDEAQALFAVLGQALQWRPSE